MTAAVGCRIVQVPDEQTGGSFAALVTYPSTGVEKPEQVVRFSMDVALNGPVADGRFPLVVVSHGTGGSYLLYRGLGAYLAARGYVVAAPSHPGNNRDDNHLAGTDTILAERPRHVSLTVDALLADTELGPHVDPNAVAVVGHSLGGYTALAVAGGRPMAFAHEAADGVPHGVPVTPDERVKAVVLLAPATPWYMAAGALAEVRVPIQLWTAECDEHAPAWHGDIVLRGVPATTSVEHHVVQGAGHFSFLAPFPAHLASPAFPPSQDPPGFDREAFHRELYPAVEGFLRRVPEVGC